MLANKFRLQCPTETRPPPPTTEDKPVKLDGFRADNRTKQQLRPIFLKTGLIHDASGSAYLEMGNTKTLTGQQFSAQGKIQCEFKFAPFAGVQRCGYTPDAQEKELSLFMAQALEQAVRLDKFPKSVLDIYVTVIQNDGAAFAAAINCASLAIASAGVEMYDLVAACGAVVHGNSIVLDASLSEESTQDGAVHVAFLPALSDVTFMLQTGQLKENAVKETLESCLDGCAKIHEQLQASLVASARKKLPASA
eukprot:Colp12_sorted_trinity150504_noHs@34953